MLSCKGRPGRAFVKTYAVCEAGGCLNMLKAQQKLKQSPDELLFSQEPQKVLFAKPYISISNFRQTLILLPNPNLSFNLFCKKLSLRIFFIIPLSQF